MPTPKLLEVRKLRFAAEQTFLDHTVEIVVNEQRSIGNQEWQLIQHIVDRPQEIRELRAEVVAMACPFLETALSELPFLVSDKHDAFSWVVMGRYSCR